MHLKTVLITGASSGIGKAIAEHLSEKGYTVFGTSRNPKKTSEKNDFEMIVLEVTQIESIWKAVDYVIGKSGRIDVLINNAGMGIAGPLEEIPEAEIKRVFETNFFGPINLMKAVLPQMRKQGSGLIINTTSIAGYMGLPFRGVYSATKGALELLTESINMEVKKQGSRLVNLAPGDFATNIASGRYHAPLQEKSPYFLTYQTSLEMMNAHVDSGADPRKIARLVEQIMLDKNPKIHYKAAGMIEKFGIVLKRILPDKVYERMLMKHFKL